MYGKILVKLFFTFLLGSIAHWKQSPPAQDLSAFGDHS